MIDLTVQELEAMEKDPELARKYVLDNQSAEADGKKSKSDTLTQAEMKKLDEAIDEQWLKELAQLMESETADALLQPSPLELMQDGPAGSARVHSAEAPELGKVPGVEGLYMTASDAADEGQDDAGRYQELKRLTGMTLREIMSLNNKVLVRRCVVNQTRLGKVRSWSIVAMAGNGDGRLGLGIGKSTDARIASETARMLAIRNMKPIRRYENRTIYGNVKVKISGTVVEMYTRPAGMYLSC
jgi:small subunit ribosomal protein S5